MIWHKNERAVQPKVDPANMLIQGQFLKVQRVQNRVIFGPSKVLEIMLRLSGFSQSRSDSERES